jgi:lipoate---protein ligase
MQVSGVYKAQKGLIKVNAEIDNETIKEIRITGDFFMYPEEAISLLELRLVGRTLDKRDLENAAEEFYLTGVDTPLITKDDFVNAILGAKIEDKVAER